MLAVEQLVQHGRKLANQMVLSTVLKHAYVILSIQRIASFFVASAGLRRPIHRRQKPKVAASERALSLG